MNRRGMIRRLLEVVAVVLIVPDQPVAAIRDNQIIWIDPSSKSSCRHLILMKPPPLFIIPSHVKQHPQKNPFVFGVQRQPKSMPTTRIRDGKLPVISSLPSSLSSSATTATPASTIDNNDNNEITMNSNDDNDNNANTILNLYEIVAQNDPQWFESYVVNIIGRDQIPNHIIDIVHESKQQQQQQQKIRRQQIQKQQQQQVQIQQQQEIQKQQQQLPKQMQQQEEDSKNNDNAIQIGSDDVADESLTRATSRIASTAPTISTTMLERKRENKVSSLNPLTIDNNVVASSDTYPSMTTITTKDNDENTSGSKAAIKIITNEPDVGGNDSTDDSGHEHSNDTILIDAAAQAILNSSSLPPNSDSENVITTPTMLEMKPLAGENSLPQGDDSIGNLIYDDDGEEESVNQLNAIQKNSTDPTFATTATPEVTINDNGTNDNNDNIRPSTKQHQQILNDENNQDNKLDNTLGVYYRDTLEPNKNVIKMVPLAMVQNLGYTQDDMVRLDPSVVDFIVMEKITKPKAGIPNRWMNPNNNPKLNKNNDMELGPGDDKDVWIQRLSSPSSSSLLENQTAQNIPPQKPTIVTKTAPNNYIPKSRGTNDDDLIRPNSRRTKSNNDEAFNRSRENGDRVLITPPQPGGTASSVATGMSSTNNLSDDRKQDMPGNKVAARDDNGRISSKQNGIYDDDDDLDIDTASSDVRRGQRRRASDLDDVDNNGDGAIPGQRIPRSPRTRREINNGKIYTGRRSVNNGSNIDNSKKSLSDPPSIGPWPDMDSFRSLLRNEASLRLRILGDDYADIIKEESDWRLNLYKGWLKILNNGIGNPIIESRSDRIRRENINLNSNNQQRGVYRRQPGSSSPSSSRENKRRDTSSSRRP